MRGEISLLFSYHFNQINSAEKNSSNYYNTKQFGNINSANIRTSCRAINLT